jgi:hypothetical protein
MDAERGHGDGEQQHDGDDPGQRRAGQPRGEVDRHRQRRAAHALEQPRVAGGRDPDDDRRVARRREAEDRDRRRVELGERHLAGGADGLDLRVAVEAVEQHHEHERERERERERAARAQLRAHAGAEPAAEQGQVGTGHAGSSVSLR